MKIDKLNLYSYGKFENVELSFKNGLNIIYGENGKGKTTIATAVKTFLYKKYKSDLKYKKNYIPLNNKDGGYDVVFSLDNKDLYETNITLGKTASKTIFNTKKYPYGSDVNIGDYETGEYFLGISEEMFDSVCSIRSPYDFEKISLNNDIVGETLSDSSSENDGNLKILNAINELDKSAKEFQRKTSSGKIYPLECELDEINNKILEAEHIKKESEKLKKQTDDIISEINETQKKYNNLLKESEKHKLYEEYNDYLLYARQEEKEKNLLNEIEKLNSEPDFCSESEISEILRFNNKDYGEKSVVKENFTFGFSAILTALCALFIYFYKWMLIPAGAFAAISLVSLFILLRSGKQINISQKEYKLKENKISCILAKYNLQNIDEFYEKKSEHEAAIKQREQLIHELNILREFKRKKPNILFDSPPDKPLSTKDKVKRELKECEITLNYLKEKKAVLIERRKNLYNNFPEYDDLIKSRYELSTLIKERKQEYFITLSALKSMEEVRELYKESYLPLLRRKAEEIIKELNIADIDKLYINDFLQPSIKEKKINVIKSSEYLSSGISDSIYFAMRLAAYDIAFEEKEKPILILDDPFIRMDDEKTAAWIRYLSKKNNIQILFFTAAKRIFQFILEKDTIYGL